MKVVIKPLGALFLTGGVIAAVVLGLGVSQSYSQNSSSDSVIIKCDGCGHEFSASELAIHAALDPFQGKNPLLSLPAESAVVRGGKVSQSSAWSGYMGTGVVEAKSKDGTTIDWAFRIPKDGTYQLAFRYANPNTEGITVPVSLGQNSTMKSLHPALPFPRTGSKRQWEYVSLNTDLKAGTYTTRLEIPANTELTLDNLTVLEQTTSPNR